MRACENMCVFMCEHVNVCESAREHVRMCECMLVCVCVSVLYAGGQRTT